MLYFSGLGNLAVAHRFLEKDSKRMDDRWEYIPLPELYCLSETRRGRQKVISRAMGFLICLEMLW